MKHYDSCQGCTGNYLGALGIMDTKQTALGLNALPGLAVLSLPSGKSWEELPQLKGLSLHLWNKVKDMILLRAFYIKELPSEHLVVTSISWRLVVSRPAFLCYHQMWSFHPAATFLLLPKKIVLDNIIFWLTSGRAGNLFFSFLLFGLETTSRELWGYSWLNAPDSVQENVQLWIKPDLGHAKHAQNSSTLSFSELSPRPWTWNF